MHVLDGEIDRVITKNIVSLEANQPHDLKAINDSVVRLMLSKLDKAERAEQVVKN